MKQFAATLLSLFFALLGFAQVPGPAPEPVSAEAYQRIEAVRAREMAAFDAQEAACYQRFAVNDCLKNIQSRRRALLADLKRQETRLHEREHAQQGADALQRIEQRALELEQKKAEIAAGGGAARAQGKAQEQKDKQADHAAKAASGAGAIAAPVHSGPRPDEQARARESYARKQAEAEKKRQDLARRQAEKAAKQIKPLPAPP